MFLTLSLFTHKVVYSQELTNKVPNHNIEISFDEFASEIENSSNIQFFYLDDWVKNIRINKSYEGQLVSIALSDIFKGSELSYEYMYGYAVILIKDISKEIIRNKLISALSALPETKVVGEEESAKWGQSLILKGSIIDQNFSEPVVQATILANEDTISTNTDINGEFELNLPAGKHILTISALNYSEKHIQLLLYDSGEIDVLIEESPTTLGEVIIQSKSIEDNFNATISGKTQLTLQSIKETPAFLGEIDVIKNIQLLPGVTSVGEGSAGFNVRGGSADQNLILLDGIVIFNPTHLFGFFSAFHSDALKDVTFYRGAIPAQYGGRISSVLDIKQKDGDRKKINGSGGIGIVSSRLLIEGPLVKNKISLMVGGRSSYSDWILKNAKNVDLRESSASFYDVTSKVSAYINKRNKLSISLYASNDQFQFANDTIYNWQNKGASISYDKIFSTELTLNTTISGGSYQYEITDEDPQQSFSRQYGIDNLKTSVSLSKSLKSHEILTGVDANLLNINRGTIAPLSNESSINTIDLGHSKVRELGLFIGDDYPITTNFILSAGIRFSMFDLIGPIEQYEYVENEPKSDLNIVDISSSNKNESAAHYSGLEPRLSMKYNLNSNNFIKMGYSRSNQYIHLISNTSAISPIDAWVPSSTHLKPQIGDQFALGYFKKIPKSQIHTSIEFFYKRVMNVPEYRNNAQLILKSNIETELVNSVGRSKGAEFSILKEGRLSGTINYTFSRSERQSKSKFESLQINQNEFFAANYDRPHDLKLNANYLLSRIYSFSFNFNATSGRPLTIPTEKFVIDGVTISNYTTRNELRIPTYHRLDVSLLIKTNHKKNKLWEGSWALTLYNVYGRKNAYSIFFNETAGNFAQAYKLSILGSVFPSITYNFKF